MKLVENWKILFAFKLSVISKTKRGKLERTLNGCYLDSGGFTGAHKMTTTEKDFQ